jgi:tetratricopeptide (TPR) repeat protein
MKKKPVAKVKEHAAKPKKREGVKPPAKKATAKDTSGPDLRRSSLPPQAADKARHQQTVQSYEQALKAMQMQKFERAKPLLEKVLASGFRELVDRASMHLNICNQQLGKSVSSFKTAEEHYDYAVSLMNMGDYVTAREHLEKLSKQQPARDFVWYGLAVLECLTGHFPEALQHLAEAIRMNKNNRFQARNDSDFRALADDPRFTELLYPESFTNL